MKHFLLWFLYSYLTSCSSSCCCCCCCLLPPPPPPCPMAIFGLLLRKKSTNYWTITLSHISIGHCVWKKKSRCCGRNSREEILLLPPFLRPPLSVIAQKLPIFFTFLFLKIWDKTVRKGSRLFFSHFCRCDVVHAKMPYLAIVHYRANFFSLGI